MRRFLMDELVEWKNGKKRKPLILNGARQVGKTWLLKEFGRLHFENVAYVSFDNNPALASQFEADFDISRLLLMLQAESGEAIKANQTLIILDEIQECPKALTSLKYFNEEAPDYAIAAAGSLLGLTIHSGTGYPVGKVRELDLYPLSFQEFLVATGNEMLQETLKAGDEQVLNSLSTRFEALLRQYYLTGGMPEVVQSYVDEEDFRVVRAIQKGILLGYERDISKHLSVREAEYVLSAWRSIPSHLGQENKKFIFGHIKEGARAKDYRSAITWLSQSGIAVKVPRISKPGIPLSAYADESAFKLFVLDVGLLGAMTEIDPRTIVEGNRIYTEFKGTFTEQYVCQQLLSECSLHPFYWSADNSRGEIDFIVQEGGRVFPIEVKAEENLRAKSLRSFCEKYPEMQAMRLSLSGFRDEGWMQNIPLWGISKALFEKRCRTTG